MLRGTRCGEPWDPGGPPQGSCRPEQRPGEGAWPGSRTLRPQAPGTGVNTRVSHAALNAGASQTSALVAGPHRCPPRDAYTPRAPGRGSGSGLRRSALLRLRANGSTGSAMFSESTADTSGVFAAGDWSAPDTHGQHSEGVYWGAASLSHGPAVPLRGPAQGAVFTLRPALLERSADSRRRGYQSWLSQPSSTCAAGRAALPVAVARPSPPPPQASPTSLAPLFLWDAEPEPGASQLSAALVQARPSLLGALRGWAGSALPKVSQKLWSMALFWEPSPALCWQPGPSGGLGNRRSLRAASQRQAWWRPPEPRRAPPRGGPRLLRRHVARRAQSCRGTRDRPPAPARTPQPCPACRVLW